MEDTSFTTLVNAPSTTDFSRPDPLPDSPFRSSVQTQELPSVLTEPGPEPTPGQTRTFSLAGPGSQSSDTSNGNQLTGCSLEHSFASNVDISNTSSLPSVNAPTLVPPSVRVVTSQYNRLDELDLKEAKRLGLLLEDLPVSMDSGAPEYGIAYEKKGGTKASGCAAGVFASQRALQERCKQFAMVRGFQLFVSGSSTRPNGGGNVKYRCKKLHGQQFFDPETSASNLTCPFYINGYGKDGHWKITRACYLHNHYKFIGWRPTPSRQVSTTGDVSPAIKANSDENLPPKEGENAVEIKAQRNTTMSMKALCRIILDEVSQYPAANVITAKLDGKAIRRILLSQGHTINHMMASRIKRQLQEDRIRKVQESFQKLGGYLKLMAEQNAGCIEQLKLKEDGAFVRALFIPNVTLQSLQFCRKIVSLDHLTHDDNIPDTPFGKLTCDESDDTICGVYLKACTKDFNDDVITIALALVTKENQENWEWFLHELQNTRAVDWNEYTVIAGRTHGLESAIRNVWPQASHHFCMRRLVDEELIKAEKIPITPDKKQSIFDLARSDSKTEYDTLRKALVRSNKAVVAFLDKVERKNWVKYAFLESFGRPTFNELTSDLSMALGINELATQYASASHTSWFGTDLIGSSHPLFTFNQYFVKLAGNFDRRRESVKQRPQNELVPRRDAQLQQILQGSQRCESIPNPKGVYMVRYLGPTRLNIPDSWRQVNLDKWECTCQDWQDQHFPCLHAIHAAELDQRRIDTLYELKWNSVENYLACYSAPFTLVDVSVIQPDVTLKTPLDFHFSEDGSGKRKPGPRPKKRKRIEDDKLQV